VTPKTVYRILALKGWFVHQRSVTPRPRARGLVSLADRSNDRWATDVTHVFCGRDGWAHLAVVLDCHDRELSFAKTQSSRQVVDLSEKSKPIAGARFGSTVKRVRAFRGRVGRAGGPRGPSGNPPRQWSIPVRPSGPLPSARGPGGSRSARAVPVTRVHRAPAGGASGAAVALHHLGTLAATSNPQLQEREQPGRRQVQPSRPARLSRPWAAWPPDEVLAKDRFQACGSFSSVSSPRGNYNRRAPSGNAQT